MSAAASSPWSDLLFSHNTNTRTWACLIMWSVIPFVKVRPAYTPVTLSQLHFSSSFQELSSILRLFPRCLPIFLLSCSSIHPPDGFNNRSHATIQSSAFCSHPSSTCAYLTSCLLSLLSHHNAGRYKVGLIRAFEWSHALQLQMGSSLQSRAFVSVTLQSGEC